MGERHRHVLSQRAHLASAPPLRGAAVTTFLLASLAAGEAVAAPEAPRAVVLAPVTPLAECPTCAPLHAPAADSEPELSELAREVADVTAGAAEDLGLAVAERAAVPVEAASVTEAGVLARASDAWVFSPRVAIAGDRVVVRLVAAHPGSRVLLLRTEELDRKDLGVRLVLMMRDLVRAVRPAETTAGAAPAVRDDPTVVHKARSRGRAVLALNAAVLGGYVGFALQRAGGSSDARLTYPLIALGTGLGLGASMIVADEWDVGVGDAWYLSAGTWWPVMGALLVAEDEPARKRFLYGAGAAAAGLALATTALSFGPMSEGGALVAHSGGGFGTLLGGIADLAVQGRTDVTPTLGMGTGAIAGVVLAGALARFTPPQAGSRVLLVDLSAGLGALTGAAVASPLIFGDEVSPLRHRLWLSSIALGTFVGAGVGYFTTRGGAKPAAPRRADVMPYFGAVAETPRADGGAAPVPGVGVRGVW